MGTGEFDSCIRLLRELVLEEQCTSPVPAWRQNCTIKGVVQPVLPAHHYQYVGLTGYYSGYDRPQESNTGKKKVNKARIQKPSVHKLTAFDKKDFLERLRVRMALLKMLTQSFVTMITQVNSLFIVSVDP